MNAILFLVTANLVVVVEAKSPAQELLESRGLAKRGRRFLLRSEIEFSQRLGKIGKTEAKVKKALKQQQEFERQRKAHKQESLGYIEQRRQLNAQLAYVTTVRENNRLIGRINDLNDRIRLLSEQGMFEEQQKLIDAAVAESRQAYIQKILELRTLADQTQSRYAELREDPAVEPALEELSVGRKRPLELGPLPNFTRYLQQLEKLESAVLTDTIDLRMERGNVLWLDVVLNGEVTEAMVFDTGAAMIVLSARTAAKCGLKPSEKDPDITIRVADGRTVKASRMTLKSVKVGRFSVDQVDCVVLPAHLDDVSPLLGGTFLRHFIYQIDHMGKKLTLSKIRTDGENE